MLHKKISKMLPLLAALVCPLAQGASANEDGVTSHYSPVTKRLTAAEGDQIQTALTSAPTNVLKISHMNAVLAELNPHARSIEFRDVTNAAQKASTAPLTPGRATPRLSDAMNADPSLWLDGALAAVGMFRLDTFFVYSHQGTHLPEQNMLRQLLSGEDVLIAATYANAQFKNAVYQLSLEPAAENSASIPAGPLGLIFDPENDTSPIAFDFDRINSFMPGNPLYLTVGETAIGTLTRVALPENDAALPLLTQRFKELPDDLRIEPRAAHYSTTLEDKWYTPYLQSAWNWVTYLVSLFDWKNYI